MIAPNIAIPIVKPMLFATVKMLERKSARGMIGSAARVSHQTNTVGNQVIDNYIGTDVTGNATPSYSHNSEQGVNVEDGVQNTLVSGNVIGS